MLDRLERGVGEIPVRDLAGAVRNMHTGFGIHRDKAQLLAGDPTHRVERRSAGEVLRALKAKGVVVEGYGI